VNQRDFAEVLIRVEELATQHGIQAEAIYNCLGPQTEVKAVEGNTIVVGRRACGTVVQGPSTQATSTPARTRGSLRTSWKRSTRFNSWAALRSKMPERFSTERTEDAEQ